MKKRVYSLCFIVYSIFLISTIHYTLSTASFAQQDIHPSQEEKIQKAREHFVAGKELIQQGNYAAANDEFKKAQGLLGDASSHKPPSEDKPEGSGLPSDKPEGDGAASDSRSHRQSHQPEGSGWEDDVDEALSFYLKAIELAPKDIDRHYNLALLYLKTKQYKEAAARLEKVIQLNPKDKDAYYNLGVLYESYLGNKKKALDYYAQYIKYSSANGDALEVKQWMRQLKKELKE